MLVAFGPIEVGHAQTGVSIEPSEPDVKSGGSVAPPTVEDESVPPSPAEESSIVKPGGSVAPPTVEDKSVPPSPAGESSIVKPGGSVAPPTVKDESVPASPAEESSFGTRIREFGSRGVEAVSQVFQLPSIESINVWMEDRVEIGLRSISFQLETDHKSSSGGRDTFLGSITDLEEDNDLVPTRIFVDYLVTPFWGVELSYDKIVAATKTSSAVNAVKSDGDVELSGPILSVFGRYPNDTAFVPYAGLGIAFYDADFSGTAHWALGYSGPAEYAAAGSPNTSKGGRTRSMDVDVDPEFVIYGGALWNFRDHWALDLYIRQMDVDVDASFTGKVRERVEQVKKGSFPMGHVAYGASMHYIF
jgi:outer membrane protein W